jgi:hypothetical protein
MADIQFIGDQGPSVPEEATADTQGGVRVVDADNDSAYPDPILKISEETEKRLIAHITEWLTFLQSSQEPKVKEWADQEAGYRAISEGPKSTPYVGACGDVVPVIAMGVDPVHARLDTGIFKAKPVFKLTGLKKSVLKYIDALEQWIEYYQKHRMKFRSVASPRILEMSKHGTMIYKTVYERETYKIKTYDRKWKVVEKEITTFSGPKTYGISIQDLLFPPGYQHINDCPFVAEKIRTSFGNLKIAEASNKVKNVDKLRGLESSQKDTLRDERQTSANHQESGSSVSNQLEVYEIWMDFALDDDMSKQIDPEKELPEGFGIPDRLVVTWHEPTQTILQLRYNWYFHQRKPYTVIPYQITNDSLWGIGIAEMSAFFQDAQTKWHRMATDNAYLANIRMFIAKKESGIEEVPKLYTGRTFFVDNPATDFVPFAAADVYGSTLSERQNLFGLGEKRTGVSDYLTGRESPVVGSRATATSTVALIQEGTRRVEEVLENIRSGYAEIMQMCIHIWIQYGLDGVEDAVFGGDDVAQLVKDFFDEASQENVSGMIAIDLQATDAANNKSVQQQVQLAIIQTMMQYLDKLVQAGQLALGAAQQQPELTALIGEVMTASRKMFTDLLTKYDIRNPEDYLPDLEKHLNGAVAAAAAAQSAGQGQPGGPAPQDTGTPGAAGVPGGAVPPDNATAAFAARTGVGDPTAPITPAAG